MLRRCLCGGHFTVWMSLLNACQNKISLLKHFQYVTAKSVTCQLDDHIFHNRTTVLICYMQSGIMCLTIRCMAVGARHMGKGMEAPSTEVRVSTVSTPLKMLGMMRSRENAAKKSI